MRVSFALGLIPWLASSAFGQSTPFDPCPARCDVSGWNPSNWTYLHGERALQRCEETTLFDMTIYTPIDSLDTHVTFRACKASSASTTQNADLVVTPFAFGLSRRDADPGCVVDAEILNNKTDGHFLRWDGNTDSGQAENIIAAADALGSFLKSGSECGVTVMFARSGNAVVGLYVGQEVHKLSAAKILQEFADAVEENPSSNSLALQLCRDGEQSNPSPWLVGVYADASGDIAAVQNAVRSWSDAKCFAEFDSEEVWENLDIQILRATGTPQAMMALESGLEQSVAHENRSSTSRTPRHLEERYSPLHDLHRRADCRAIQVATGDGCQSLATRCGITQVKLEQYNKVSNFCDTLQPAQWICCSAGTLPDFSPKPNPDGTCATYTIKQDDICYDIAETYYLTVDEIEDLNGNTWGWTGCRNLQLGQRICLSTGDPPMPAPIPNAVCGPQVPNTPRPTGKKELKDLNPCPLNVCCNVWGQCGMTKDFCIESPADTGAPGTSKPGANGCISNCGMDIVNNEEGPDSFSAVAYFEAWNEDRPCLLMDVTDINTDYYTHIHFAFGDITPEFEVDISRVEDQFNKLKSMTGIKRILSFGGWVFSTERPTYTIFREGVTPENRALFAYNVANFITDHDLDGVDFDWEYPSAPDLGTNIPPGVIEEGQNYLLFLELMRIFLPDDKSLSIAAPASYWYLRGFPIGEIAETVDYIIYMTYDLHGQWDYGNKWSSDGCPEGNCLRSHINLTETETALAMITKAGVPAKKVFCGVTSYGRSFKMAKKGCTGPMCRFTGSRTISDAAPGPCTNTSGYIASAEIREIIRLGMDDSDFMTYSYFDDDSNSNILVYDDTEWVAWMDDETKVIRGVLYQIYNFGGISDWAVDLDRYGGDGSPDPDEDPDYGSDFVLCETKTPFNSLEELEAALDEVPGHCRDSYILGVLEKMLDGAMAKYRDVDNGYDSKFESYSRYMRKTAPAQLERFMRYPDGEGQPYFHCLYEGDLGTYDAQCPVVPHYMEYTSLLQMTHNIHTYTLRDVDGFYAALLEEFGLAEDDIEFDHTRYQDHCRVDTLPHCGYSLTTIGKPVVKPDFEPPNPKDLVQEALESLPALYDELKIAFLELSTLRWMGNDEDVVQVLSMPVFMLIQAVEAMEDAKEIGEEIEEQEQKNLILTIISAILFFVPFFGELLAVAAGMARIGRMIALAGAAGEAGLALVDIIDNPEAAPMAILSMLTRGKLKTPKAYGDAAKTRRGMSPDDVGKLGSVFKQHDEVLQRILKTC